MQGVQDQRAQTSWKAHAQLWLKLITNASLHGTAGTQQCENAAAHFGKVGRDHVKVKSLGCISLGLIQQAKGVVRVGQVGGVSDDCQQESCGFSLPACQTAPPASGGLQPARQPCIQSEHGWDSLGRQDTIHHECNSQPAMNIMSLTHGSCCS